MELLSEISYIYHDCLSSFLSIPKVQMFALWVQTFLSKRIFQSCLVFLSKIFLLS